MSVIDCRSAPILRSERDPVMTRLKEMLDPSRESLFVIILRASEGDDQEVRGNRDSATLPSVL